MAGWWAVRVGAGGTSSGSDDVLLFVDTVLLSVSLGTTGAGATDVRCNHIDYIPSPGKCVCKMRAYRSINTL
jgi:hypothetical protein